MPDQDDIQFNAPVADAIAHLMRAALQCKHNDNHRAANILTNAAKLLEDVLHNSPQQHNIYKYQSHIIFNRV
jgi:hypothetical protein